jgi:histidinol dehydrogenase
MNIGAVTEHRKKEGDAVIYPVYSRRSGGLSIGINLFPDRKVCSFDCPYCEVFPFETNEGFTIETMKTALALTIRDARLSGIPVKDICFSGSGEPSMSPWFTKAVTAAAALQKEMVPDAKLVVITNGSGMLNRELFEFLQTAALPVTAETPNTSSLPAGVPGLDLHIWLKLDAATASWYRLMNRSDIPHGELLSGIRSFAATSAPFTVQTMLCMAGGALPPTEETTAWVQLVTELAVLSSHLRAVQIYGKARPAPEDPLTETVPAALLEERASLLRLALEKAKQTVPVEVYE